MTVQNNPSEVTFVGTGVQTSFVFTFRVDDIAWLSVDFLTNFDQFLINADQEATPGGSVEYLVAPPNLQELTVTRTTPKDQETDYTRYDAFDSETHEFGLDKLTMLVQDVCAAIDGHILDLDIHFSDAPADGVYYSRRNNAWEEPPFALPSDHLLLVNIGVNSHADIDAHIANTTIHFGDAPATGDDYARNNNAWVVSPPAVNDHLLLLNIGVNTHAQIDTHLGDSTIHFLEASIDHAAIQNIGVNTHAVIDNHIANSGIHFTIASIDHLTIQNIGVNSHADIDVHIGTTDIHFVDAPADASSYVRNNNAWVLETVQSFGEYSGEFDASIGTFPVTTNQGDWFNCTVAGVVDGQAFIIGDILVALINNPSTVTFAANWSIIPHIGVADHFNLTNIGVNTHVQLDTHLADATIHFTEASIDHVNIASIGVNTHVQIDAHIADASIHGDVFKVGVPANNQFGVWTGDGTIEGISELIFDGAKLIVDTAFYIEQRAASLASFLTLGEFWVRDDIQNVPMFTNNFGNDVVLAGISLAGGASNQIAHFTGVSSIEGDANLLYDSTAEMMTIQVVLNSINNVGLLLIDSDSVLNPDGWQFCPGQAGLHDGTLILTHDPSDTLNNRDLTMIPGARPAFAFGLAVAPGTTYADENAGALAYFQPRDITGREETKISFVGFVGGTGHEGVFSIEGFNYGNAGLQFNRVAHFVVDADYTIHTDLFGTLNFGTLGVDAPLSAGDNASIGYSQANGLEITGQGTTNDLVFFNDNHNKILSFPSSGGKMRLHYRFGDTRYMEMEMNNTNWQMVGVNNVNNFAITGIGGLFSVDAGATFQGDLIAEVIRPSSTVILANFTDAELNAIGNAVNTDGGKAAGAMVFNSDQGHAVTAQGATAGSVWNDGVGTTVNTPV